MMDLDLKNTPASNSDRHSVIEPTLPMVKTITGASCW